MAYPDDDTAPYWASTVPVLGLDDGQPKGPLDLPLEFLLSGQFARAMSEASNPRIPHDLMPFPYLPSLMRPLAPPIGDWSSSPSLPTPADISAGFASPSTQLPPSFAPAPPVEHLDAGKYWGASPALPEAPAPSSAHRFDVSPAPQGLSWDAMPAQPADHAAQSFSPPPSPPSWDTAVPPVEYPDLARYWSAPPAPSDASAQPPTAPPTWLPAAEWKPPEASRRLSFSGPDRAPGIEPSWDHLWPTESAVPKTWHQRSLDALHRLDEALWYVTPPELRPKAAAAVQFLKSIAPGSGTADSMEAGAAAEAARREGRYGPYVGNLASGMFSAASDWFPALKAVAAPMAARVARGATKTALPMDAASIAQRAKAMNMADDVFWRGERSGALPTSYPRGAHFSRFKERGDAYAQQGGRPEAREFRLDLTKALKDYEPVTAEQMGRLVASAARHDPKWAAELVDTVAPGRSVDWMRGFAKARPNDLVADSGAHIRQMIDYSANPVRILRDAGFNALDTGVDVRKLDGYGIRLANAVFDPARRRSRNISAALAGGAAMPTLAEILMNPSPD